VARPIARQQERRFVVTSFVETTDGGFVNPALVEIVGPPRRSGSDSGSWEVPVVLASGAQRTAGPFPSREACREAFGL